MNSNCNVDGFYGSTTQINNFYLTDEMMRSFHYICISNYNKFIIFTFFQPDHKLVRVWVTCTGKYFFCSRLWHGCVISIFIDIQRKWNTKKFSLLKHHYMRNKCRSHFSQTFCAQNMLTKVFFGTQFILSTLKQMTASGCFMWLFIYH